MYKSFDEYLVYMEKNKDLFPTAIYQFATDVCRHKLDSPHSLHDSWLTSITFKENRNKERPFNPKQTLEIILLGQMHDRDIYLKYEGVSVYRIEVSNGNSNDTFLGDLLKHEIKVTESKSFTHELEFASKSSIFIEFTNLKCNENVYP